MPPVCSPTAIMEITMGGNTLDLASGAEIVSPPAIDARDSITALWITMLPAGRAGLFRPSGIGTPEGDCGPGARGEGGTAGFWWRWARTGGVDNNFCGISLPGGR